MKNASVYQIEVEQFVQGSSNVIKRVGSNASDVGAVEGEAVSIAQKFSSDHCVYVYESDALIGRVDILGGGRVRSVRMSPMV